MCGIFGYFDCQNNSVPDQTLTNMGDILAHRGPDGSGYHHDKHDAVALGNVRLAIIDLDNGQQPFYSDDETIIVVQNGEIFNYVELAADLLADGYPCLTNCDTEVILRIYERDGITGIHKLNGMFAISIYDKNINSLYLVRDRVGEKPLYFSHAGKRIFYASEIKSILQVLDNKKPNFDAINQFLTFNYVPPPITIFEDIFHVKPGTYLKITNDSVEEYVWYDLSKIESLEQSEADWIEEFISILDDAVRIRLRSDVPFGAFLSGGVDSSTVVGLMANHTKNPVNTYCIGFRDPEFDETAHAATAAKRFKTFHTAETVGPDLMDLWPMTTYHCDQPHGDISFLPTLKVAQLAARKVKVVLTGDGADELFAGYDKYRDFFGNDVNHYDDNEFQSKYLDNVSLFTAETKEKLYSNNFKNKVTDLSAMNVINPLIKKSEKMDRINQALYIDTMLLLPGNNLVKPDRMGMAASIETRAPFLDFRMLSLAFSMPGRLKLKNGKTKYLYKKAVAPLISTSLSYRKKQMFTVPVGDWFKTDLADMCDDLLLSDRTRERELFDYDYVSSLLDGHKNGSKNNTREIRALMALELWFREFF